MKKLSPRHWRRRMTPDNDKQARRAVIKTAYISCVDHYIRIAELPTGHGYADVVYLSRKKSPFPAMIIELKMNLSPASVLEQIEERNYPQALKHYGGPLLAVGVTYDAKTKKHSCRIREIVKSEVIGPHMIESPRMRCADENEKE